MLFVNAKTPKNYFEELVNSSYFVDKTGLISAVVPYIGAQENCICVTRPRSFNKTANARMLASFLSRGAQGSGRDLRAFQASDIDARDFGAGYYNAREVDDLCEFVADDPEVSGFEASNPVVSDLDEGALFDGLKVAQNVQAMQHLGAHDVIYIDFSDFSYGCENYAEYLDVIRDGIISDLRTLFPEAFSPEAGVSENECSSENEADNKNKNDGVGEGDDANKNKGNNENKPDSESGCNNKIETSLPFALEAAYTKTGAKFCFIMDEWDYVFSNVAFSDADQQEFLAFLKQLLKDKPYVDFAYMTGIVPVSKHAEAFELNMFNEYSALDDPLFSEYFGFTESEVRELCEAHAAQKLYAQITYEQLDFWYGGYLVTDGGIVGGMEGSIDDSIDGNIVGGIDSSRRFNPHSVVLALNRDRTESFCVEASPYDKIYYYIRNNVAAVRDDIARMVAGERVCVDVESVSFGSKCLKSLNARGGSAGTTLDNPTSAPKKLTTRDGFANSKMRNSTPTSEKLNTRDEILTSMVIYGFLTYRDGCVSIPNHEMMLKFQKTLKRIDAENPINPNMTPTANMPSAE